MYLLNFLPDYIIEINAVSVVNLVMACGLSVEFTVHIIIFYFRSKKVAQKSLNLRISYLYYQMNSFRNWSSSREDKIYNAGL